MKINEKKIDKIISLVEKGFLQYDACMEVGVDQQTFDEWKKKRKKQH